MPVKSSAPDAVSAPRTNQACAYVYMVECADGTLYTGWTTNLVRRLAAHNAGRGARYTRGRTPVHLVYWEAAENRSAALKRECVIKQLDTPAKRQLAHSLRNT